MRTLDIKDIKDPVVKENFKKLNSDFRDVPLLNGQFKFFSIDLVSTTYPAEIQFKHGLRFVPKDILQTSVTGTGGIVWDYAAFTSEYLYGTITGPVTVRAFIGNYQEGSRA